MPKQSTRHKYKTKREKSQERSRIFKIVATGLAIFIILMLLRNGRDIYNYLRTSIM